MKDNIEKFLKYLKYEKNYSEHTIIGYENHINLFYKFIKSKGIDNYKTVDYSIIRNYINYLYKMKYSSKVYVTILVPLGRFLNI